MNKIHIKNPTPAPRPYGACFFVQRRRGEQLSDKCAYNSHFGKNSGNNAFTYKALVHGLVFDSPDIFPTYVRTDCLFRPRCLSGAHDICPKPGSPAPCQKPGSLTPCPEHTVFARSSAFDCNTPCPVEQSMHAKFVFSMATYASVLRANIPVSAHQQTHFVYVHIIHIKNPTPLPRTYKVHFLCKA